LPSTCKSKANDGSAAAEPSFAFDLQVDGKSYETAQSGDILTVSLYLERIDSSDSYMMHAMQAEIAYDSCFRLVDGSAVLNRGVVARDIASTDGCREFYMNYLSRNGGSLWNSRTLIGSFQLEVTATSGTGCITNRDYLVSTQDGRGSYPSSSNQILVEIIPDEKTEYIVDFDTQGGSKVPRQTVPAGQHVERPANPMRHGYSFMGWYRDADCTERWDFDRDTLHQNITLYARWINLLPDMNPNTSDTFNPGWCVVLILSGMALLYFTRKRHC